MLSADGCVEAFDVDETGCCPPPMCGNDLCCTFVAFFNLLPSGPMWDHWKAQAISYFESAEDPAECPLLEDPQCPSLILHAIYAVLKLRGLVHNALWPALRESNPVTAVTTLDDHLARLQWEDCYNQHCRSVLLGDITPLEVWSDCGPVFCPPDYPPELENAVKRNIAIALTRANMGIIKNLCSINWVIEPLGAELNIALPTEITATMTIVEPRDYGMNDHVSTALEECVSMCGEPVLFEIGPTRDWIEGVGTGDICDTRAALPHVTAYWDRGCDRPAGLPERVWPAVLAAECIVRSMLPPTCHSNIRRTCGNDSFAAWVSTDAADSGAFTGNVSS